LRPRQPFELVEIIFGRAQTSGVGVIGTWNTVTTFTSRVGFGEKDMRTPDGHEKTPEEFLNEMETSDE